MVLRADRRMLRMARPLLEESASPGYPLLAQRFRLACHDHQITDHLHPTSGP
jgi:hypothetical protein